MPSRRNPANTVVAALKSDRLPLGTPTFPKSPSTIRSTSNSPTPAEPHLSDNTASKVVTASESKSIYTQRMNMTIGNISEADLAKSIAEAKLERQRKRNEEVDMNMTRKQTGRSKARQWKPFNMADETGNPMQSHDAAASFPVSENRVNTFRPFYRETSSIRSESLLSHPASDTGPFDMERQDSGQGNAGFQVFNGHNASKVPIELNAYEQRSEERQGTVEAVFNTGEICDVFGNALPTPDYIQQTVGNKNGQVQFIQHPNGDISAQQWSHDRYMWDNVGQFSNIRKKVEGQLASDRLKGETAQQTLQQHTLAYFRTIALQREATVMGLTFGAKEIQASMPQRASNSSAPACVSSRSNTQEHAVSRPSRAVSDTRTSQLPDHRDRFASIVSGTAHNSSQLQNHHYGPTPDQMYHGSFYGQQHMALDDPFYSYATYQRIYGSYQTPQQYYGRTPYAQHQLNAPLFGMAPRVPGLNYNFNFPAICHERQPASTATLQHENLERFAAAGGYDPRWQHHPEGRAAASLPHLNLRRTDSQSAFVGVPARVIAAPQPKPVVPLANRASMSDQLWKISETAKERNNSSQPSMSRTVLYDPFQSSSDSTVTANAVRHSKQDSVTQDAPVSGPTFTQNVAGNKLQPPASYKPSAANFFPTVLAPELPAASPPPRAIAIENDLQESSPDTTWSRRPYDHRTPLIASTTETQHTPQNFNGPFFTAGDSLHEPDSKTKGKTYDEVLNDWWTSGNKFARQEEFFESVMAANKLSMSTDLTTSPPAQLAPICPASRTPAKAATGPYNPITTRLLIPVLESLASYVQGPMEKRRDYFSRWSQPPEWCIDRSEGSNDSFYDKDWGQPPARVGRDPRYRNQSWTAESMPTPPPPYSRFAHGGSQGRAEYGISHPVGSITGVGGGIDRRFNFPSHY